MAFTSTPERDPRKYPRAAAPRSSVELIDLDGDGFLDLVEALHGASRGFGVRYGTGYMAFAEPVEYRLAAAHGDATAVHVSDLDGDEDLDVAVVYADGPLLAFQDAKRAFNVKDIHAGRDEPRLGRSRSSRRFRRPLGGRALPG